MNDPFIRFINSTRRAESGPVISGVRCLEWTRRPHSAGYGELSVNNKKTLAHRYSYATFRGQIPAGNGFHGTCVLHSCDNRICVEPAHLFLGTQQENLRDMRIKGRERHPRGEQVSRSLLTEQDVLTIRSDYSSGTPTRMLSSKYGVHENTIRGIVTGQKWKHLPLSPLPKNRHGARRLSKADVLKIRELYASGVHKAVIAKMFSITALYAYAVAVGNKRKDVPSETDS